MSESPTPAPAGLSRESIFKSDDMVIERVEVPEWGGAVYVRSVSAKGRDAWEGSRYRLQGDKVVPVYENTRAKLLVMCVCDEQGKLLFTEADVERLGQKNGAVLDRLFDVAMRLSGMRDKAVEQAAKNSAAVQTDGSSSSSPDTSGRP
ncbi:hypothetical protein [Candidatus Nitrospira bockiana]